MKKPSIVTMNGKKKIGIPKHIHRLQEGVEDSENLNFFG